jgi:hypothetical protein
METSSCSWTVWPAPAGGSRRVNRPNVVLSQPRAASMASESASLADAPGRLTGRTTKTTTATPASTIRRAKTNSSIGA